MNSVPVLIYHHVAPDREVTPEGFDAQLTRLKEKGWRSLSASELHDHLTGRQDAGGKALVLTFDDGYYDNWAYATPLLKKHGFLAHQFPITGRVTDGPVRADPPADTLSREREPEGFLTWDELRAMRDSGVWEIGSHTHTHRGFEREAKFADLDEELSRSRDLVSEKLGTWPGTIAWPWGDFEEEWLGRLEGHGYRLAFTAEPGSNPKGGGPWRVKRFKVQNADLAWLERRLSIYQSSALASAYSTVYGLDRKIKKSLQSDR